MSTPVLSKKDFVRRYAAGEFGNASPTWNEIREFTASRYNGLVHLRNRVAGGPTWYDISSDEAETAWYKLLEKGVKPQDLYISAMAPTAKTLFQGEVQQGINHLDLYYTTVAKPMREALKSESEQVSGIVATSLLRRYLCPNSYDWLQILLDRYPGHVVELSTYSVEWGTLPGFNTVFWEVRMY